MTAQEVKQWLSRGFWLRQEKEQIVRERQELFDRLTSITQKTDGVITSSTKDPHKFDLIAEFDSELAECEKKIDRARGEIFRAIRSLSDHRLRVIMMARYMENMSWGEIATITHYQERHVYRLHGMALDELAKTIGKKNPGGYD